MANNNNTDAQDWASFVDEIAEAITGESSSKWATGDKLARRVGVPPGELRGHANNGSSKWITAMARDLADRGLDVSESTLEWRYRTSAAFPEGTRADGVAWTVHRIIAEQGMDDAPARMRHFLASMTESGQRPSRRNAEIWLGRTPAGDSAAAVARHVGSDAEAAAAVVRKLAEQHSAAIARIVASDPVLRDAVTAALIAHDDPEDDDTPRRPRDPNKPRDYGRLIESAINSISMALIAAKSGRYELTSRDEALLYFVTMLLGERLAPEGDLAEMVGPKLSANLDEIERYANAGGTR